MPGSRVLPFAVALLLVLPALALAVGPAGAQVTPELRFVRFKDYPLDVNNNTLYDQLVVEFIAEVTQPGTYTVVTELSVNASGINLPIKSQFQNVRLEEGNNTVEVVFASEDIYRRGSSGAFRIDVEVQKFDFAGSWEITYLTSFYDHRTFEAEENPPPVPPDAPKVELDVDYVNVSAGMFQVFVNRTSPEVIYRYSESRPGLPDFVVVFKRLIFFADDGDSVYDGEEPVAGVVLTNYPWAFMNVEVSGPKVSFDLKTRVPIVTGMGFPAADVTITSIVTNGSTSYPGPSPYLRGGASELKMDIHLEMEEAIPGADHMALELEVGDTLGNHDFLMEGATGFQLSPRTNETGYLPVPRLPLAEHTKVGLVDENVVEHAFVGWVNEATADWGDQDGPGTVEVGSSFRVKGGGLELVLAYPYTPQLVSMDHDPSVGVLEDNLPPMPPGPEPPEEEVPNIYLYLFAIIVGCVILALSVYARAQGY